LSTTGSPKGIVSSELWYIDRMSSATPQGSPYLTEADVQHVAKLARLELEPQEIERMAAELSAIVGYVQKLSELDTSDVPPTAQMHVDRLVLRDDEPRPSLARDEVLGDAPRVAFDGFAVPGFVDD
jgi:aspartyl-tRNA(Asn)/glutamyl-tRNA(Gln) amidotransferase subunit C